MKAICLGIVLSLTVSGYSWPQQEGRAGRDVSQEKPKKGDTVAVLETTKGNIVVMFFPKAAPKHVKNFVSLAKSKFYDGTRFHRCIAGFMIQGGDPLSKSTGKSAMWGTGGNMVKGKEATVPAEFNDIHHGRGVLSMARSADPNSASSQFFIMVADSAFLDNQYTAFGKVVSGMDVADKIVATGPKDANANGSVPPAKAVVVKRVRITTWPIKRK